MAIVIPLLDAFDIETYDGLLAFIVAHLELDEESEAQVPTFIRLAEYKLNRMVLAPERETSASLTTVADQQWVDLPVDFRQLRTARIVAADGYPLEPVTLNELHARFTDVSGKPQVYAVAEQAVQFGPTPDAAYTISITYMARLTPLAPTNQTNWLLAGNADAYVYATLIQAEAWLGHDKRVPLLAAALAETIAEVNAQGNRYRNASPMRLRSSVVV